MVVRLWPSTSCRSRAIRSRSAVTASSASSACAARSSALTLITPNMPIWATQIAAVPITSPQLSAPLSSHTTNTAPTDATTAPTVPHRPGTSMITATTRKATVNSPLPTPASTTNSAAMTTSSATVRTGDPRRTPSYSPNT
jgi:hypothetical protein